ncbi:MAG: type II secretion system secretin GspD [Hyphomonas sp.]|nr:type II secretion system secretin GspD [Hyphomonas sp.]MCB9961393.1 type II secretion system secretin GspD [Hyphomonas sp.]MCB9971568.1 type II secretion system secretin GspD [Hyphomonas sp.]
MKRARPLLLSCAMALSALPAHALAANTPSSDSTERHVLNFEDVELSALISDVSTVTGYTFIVHPEARNKRITIASSAALTRQQVFDVFLSALRVHGFTAVPAGPATYRIVPEEAAVGGAGLGEFSANGLVTEVFSLNFADATEAARMIKPVVDEQGQVIANPTSDILIVVDYASNMTRIRDLISQIDRNPSEVETISLQNMPAAELANILTTLGGKDPDNGTAKFTAVASESGNSVVVYGSKDAVARAQRVAAELDAADRSNASLKVIPLNNADAEELVPILQQMADAMDGRRGGGDASAANVTTIAHHAPTNSLVISAPPETLTALERVISDLDQRRAQVLVEAIIVEMSDDTARELGLQFLLSGSNDSTVPFVSTNFSRSAPNLLALAGAISKDSPFNGTTTTTSATLAQSAINSLLGMTGISVGVGGEENGTLFGAILNAVENDGKSRILSKPFNMTLDHGTSSLLVGQNVPIATGEVLGDSNSNPFRTVDRRDVGVGLVVTPRIANDGTIQLDIEQEVSNIAGVVGTATTDLIFNTRKIQTSVIADDGEIIVLGGLVEQTETLDNEKVPGLGDIPVAGRLFRSEGKAVGRRNLMVFIKPTIVRDQDAADEVTRRSYRFIEAQELWNDKGEGDNSLDSFVAGVLGSAPPK